MADIYIPDSLLYCKDANCRDDTHCTAIESLYDSVIACLFRAGKTAIGECKHYGYKVIPGWTNEVKEFHKVARQNYLLWIHNGKPKHGQIFYDMYRSRLEFKYSLRKCKLSEDQHRADALARDINRKDYVQFWKKVSQINNNKTQRAEVIGEAVGEKQITEAWYEYYYKLLNEGSAERLGILSNMVCSDNYEKLCITVAEVENQIHKLKHGKASGYDGICGEHLRYAGKRLHTLLSLCLTKMCSHGFMPSNLMKTIIVPLVKNKAGDLQDMNNYRPIALAGIVSKIFEKVLLLRCNDNLSTV